MPLYLVGCRRFGRSQFPQTQKDYIRYIRSQKYAVKCFQESLASSSVLISSFDIYFQLKVTHWTPHVDILSFSHNFQISVIDTSPTYISTHFQLCKVEHPQQFYDPFFILNFEPNSIIALLSKLYYTAYVVSLVALVLSYL